MNDTVLYELHEGVAEIVLNRPARRNAMDGGMRARLGDVVSAVRDDASVRCIILRGAGGYFCSGGDLEGVRDDKDAASKRQRLIQAHATVSALMLIDRPVIAVVDGAAFGAGLGLALAADFILAAPDGAQLCIRIPGGHEPEQTRAQPLARHRPGDHAGDRGRRAGHRLFHRLRQGGAGPVSGQTAAAVRLALTARPL